MGAGGVRAFHYEKERERETQKVYTKRSTNKVYTKRSVQKMEKKRLPSVSLHKSEQLLEILCNQIMVYVLKRVLTDVVFVLL